jgi:vacuolar-type H+-ATPase subunit H
VRHEAEQQAAARKRAAEEEARRIIEDAKRDAAALLEERIRRIDELSEDVIERGETILSRLDRAAEVRKELETLVGEVGQTAARMARELTQEREAPRAEEPPVREPEPPAPEPPAAREPEPEPAVAEPEPAAEPEPPADSRQPTADTEPESARPLRVARSEEPAPASNITDLVARPAERTRAEEDDELLGARLVALQMAVAGGNRGEVEAHLTRAFDLPNPQSILDDVFGRGTDASKRVVWPSAADGS